METRPRSNVRFNTDPFHSNGAGEGMDSRVTHVTEPDSEGLDVPESAHVLDTQETQHSSHELRGADLVKSATRAARDRLHLDSIRATGPSRLFNPTNVRVHVKWAEDGKPHSSGNDAPGGIINDRAFLWRSRDNRKGRNSISIPTAAAPSPPLKSRCALGIRRIGQNIFKMCSTFPYWDMAFWSGWSYTWGSVLFVIDGAWAWKEVAYPGSQVEGLTKYGAPLCFFFGAILYQIGATMSYLEAVNDGSFQGSSMRRFLEGHEDDSKKMLDEKIHSFFGHFIPHRHRTQDDKVAEEAANAVDPEAGWRTKDRHERPGSIYPMGKAPAPRRGGFDLGEGDKGAGSLYTSWRWWPSWYCLRTHHVFEIGYLACAIQLLGATLYGITGIVDLPGILSSLADWQEEGAFWGPQIVASVCFLTASLLFTLETQERWYRPEITVLGWWIGLWATVGSVGFLLTGIFGAASFDIAWCEYQSDLSSMWGSGAYLMSGLLQWYEATNKRPVAELFREPGEMKSFQIHPV